MYINDARHSEHRVNARCYTINTCTATGFAWVRIYATRKIRVGEEIFLTYDDVLWSTMEINTHKRQPLLLTMTRQCQQRTVRKYKDFLVRNTKNTELPERIDWCDVHVYLRVKQIHNTIIKTR